MQDFIQKSDYVFPRKMRVAPKTLGSRGKFEACGK